MIARVWRGWTTQAQADQYEELLKTQIFPGILAKKIGGFLHIQLSAARWGRKSSS